MARNYSLRMTLFPPETPIVDLTTGAATDAMRLVLENFTTNFYGPTGEEDVTLAIPTGSYVAAVAVATPAKGLTVSGVIGPGYTATLDLAQDIRTSASPQFAGLNIPGNIVLAGTIDGRDPSVDGTKLDGIEAGATADQTAAEILTAIKTVDGSGSGLDADLLDGQSGAFYLAWANFTGTPTTIAGYGITNAYTKTEVDTAVGGKVTKTTGISDASTAHAVTDFATTNTALDALGAKINEIIDALNA